MFIRGSLKEFFKGAINSLNNWREVQLHQNQDFAARLDLIEKHLGIKTYKEYPPLPTIPLEGQWKLVKLCPKCKHIADNPPLKTDYSSSPVSNASGAGLVYPVVSACECSCHKHKAKK